MIRWLAVVVCSGCMVWGGISQAVELRTQSLVPLISAPVVVTARDMNWNFTPDLVVANGAANTITVIPVSAFSGMESATDYAVGSGPVAVALADFSGNGYIDIDRKSVV